MDKDLNIVATSYWSWRLIDTLLKYPITMSGALQGLEEYFCQNDQPNTPPDSIVGGA